ncbi:MAG: hypothetical protein WC130_11350 [Kiritimatiellia bacterium]
MMTQSEADKLVRRYGTLNRLIAKMRVSGESISDKSEFERIVDARESLRSKIVNALTVETESAA